MPSYKEQPLYVEMAIQEYERKTRDWDYKFCFLPYRCLETGKWLWLRHAYRGRRWRRYDIDIVLLTDKWMCKEEFIKLRLLEKV